MSSFSVCSFNCLHPYNANKFRYLPDEGRDWNSRVQSVARVVQNLLSSCDILLLQEVSSNRIEQIFKAGLQDRFDRVFVNNFSPGAQKGLDVDGLAIIYNSKRFSRLDVFSSVADLHSSQCPEVDKRCLKREMVLFLKDQITQKTIRVASIHLVGGPVRSDGEIQFREALQYYEDQSKRFEKKPDICIVGGDFNEVLNPQQGRGKIALDSGYNLDPSAKETEKDLSGNFGSRKIDHIITKGSGVRVRSVDVISTLTTVDELSLKTASDHYPTAIEIS